MNAHSRPIVLAHLALLAGCPQPWPDFVTCEDLGDCGTTTTAGTEETGVPTSDGVHTVTGDDAGTSTSGTTAPDDDSSSGTTATAATTGQVDEPPAILDRAIEPDYTDVNALLTVNVAAEHTDGVQMLLDNGELLELMPGAPGEFSGQIPAFTGLDNGQHTAVFTPWRGGIIGESVEADYVIALPPPGYEVSWQPELDLDGSVAALAVLPDGRPVEFGTYHEMGEPRCYLRLRGKGGELVEHVPVLPPAHCRAIDLAIDPETGFMYVLLERKSGNGLVWWVGEIPGWGGGPKNLGIGELGDDALALARGPGIVAVCGSKPVESNDKQDALAVLLRPDQPKEEHRFDYVQQSNPDQHAFTETARDCVFSGHTLVLVGEATGLHDIDGLFNREHLALIEFDVDADTAVWTVAGPGPGTQSRALAVAVDDDGRYHLGGYTCLDDCEPEGAIRIYEPGGELAWQAPLGLLGADWFGPHDIAWSPAGYAVIALGAQQGQSYAFKVQAFAPGEYEPLWTFMPNDKQGLQIALSLAIGPLGQVYAGGIAATTHPAFAVIGG